MKRLVTVALAVVGPLLCGDAKASGFSYVAPDSASKADARAYGACLARVIAKRGHAYAVRNAGNTVCDKRASASLVSLASLDADALTRATAR